MLKEHAFRSRDPVHFLFALVYAFLYKSSIFLPHFVAVLVLGKVSSVFVCELCALTLGVDCTMECWLVVWSCHCVPFRFFSCACVANPTFEVTGEWRTGPMWVKLQVSTNPSWRKQTPKKRTLYQPKKVSRARYAPRALCYCCLFAKPHWVSTSMWRAFVWAQTSCLGFYLKCDGVKVRCLLWFGLCVSFG